MTISPKKLPVELPEMVRVTKVEKEGKICRTIYFKSPLTFRPGQFIMVWIPRIEEKPMAISYSKKGTLGFTYHSVGPFTKACDQLRVGSVIGIRGPYGNSFSLGQKACVVGGGVGMASVSCLIDHLKDPYIINGARTKSHLIFLKRYKNKKMIVTTDDGSEGRKGYTTHALKGLLEEGGIKTVYTCGPEAMMKKVVDLCNEHNVHCEASVERYMKCGFGICGNCMCGDSIVCMDGPIFTGKALRSNIDFGRSARIKTGKKVTLAQYYAKS